MFCKSGPSVHSGKGPARGQGGILVRFVITSAFAIAPMVAATTSAFATTHRVGAGAIVDLNHLPAVQPGDVIELMGGQSYPPTVLKFQGTPAQKITVRGVRVGGQRPVIAGGETTLEIRSSHVVLEGLDITGGARRCVFHHANDVTIRDSVIHHCQNDGLIGADNDSGTLTLESSEIHHNGNGERFHQIYMSTDQLAYPGSVFRMQFCYLHDGNGGNGIKTRAERNEIYYNWIEGAYYHDIELIGPDPSSDVPEDKVREDSDVVGNVFRKSGLHTSHFVARVGGDGTGQTAGRFRFVNNTFLLAPDSAAAFRLFDRVDTLEMHNNVFHRLGGGAVAVLRTAEVAAPAPLVTGSNNWFPTGSEVPGDWTGSRFGADPGFVNAAANDLRPGAGSPLVDQGQASPPSSARPFPGPLATQAFQPPVATCGPGAPRRTAGAPDLGAFESGEAAVTAATPAPAPLSPAAAPSLGAVTDGINATEPLAPPATGCSLGAGGAPGGMAPLAVALLLAAAAILRSARAPSRSRRPRR